jgi:5-formyltetrahydrofolate cyclo-ligase
VFKSKLRKKILKLREVENFKNIKIDFDNVFDLLKKNNLTKKCIGGYFPVNHEIDDLEILKKLKKKKISNIFTRNQKKL